MIIFLVGASISRLSDQMSGIQASLGLFNIKCDPQENIGDLFQAGAFSPFACFHHAQKRSTEESYIPKKGG